MYISAIYINAAHCNKMLHCNSEMESSVPILGNFKKENAAICNEEAGHMYINTGILGQGISIYL